MGTRSISSIKLLRGSTGTKTPKTTTSTKPESSILIPFPFQGKVDKNGNVVFPHCDFPGLDLHISYDGVPTDRENECWYSVDSAQLGESIGALWYEEGGFYVQANYPLDPESFEDIGEPTTVATPDQAIRMIVDWRKKNKHTLLR